MFFYIKDSDETQEKQVLEGKLSCYYKVHLVNINVQMYFELSFLSCIISHYASCHFVTISFCYVFFFNLMTFSYHNKRVCFELQARIGDVVNQVCILELSKNGN